MRNRIERKEAEGDEKEEMEEEYKGKGAQVSPSYNHYMTFSVGTRLSDLSSSPTIIRCFDSILHLVLGRLSNIDFVALIDSAQGRKILPDYYLPESFQIFD